MADRRGRSPPPPYGPNAQQQQQQHQQQLKAFMAAQQAVGSGPYARQGRQHPPAGPRGGGPGTPSKPNGSNAKMGIKSGMTVEDLKRLTQQRIQQTAGQDPLTQRPATPTLNMSAVNMPSMTASGTATGSVMTPASTAAAAAAGTSSTVATATTPVVPKAGMSVQELKQLTSLRLASQNVPMHQSEITGLVSKAVLSNAAKSHYRESLRGSLTPSTTPKRTPTTMTPTAHATSSPPMPDPSGRHSLPSRPLGIPGMRGGNDGAKVPDYGMHASVNQMRYSYPGPEEFNALDSGSSQDTDTFTRPSLDHEDESKLGYDEQYQSLQFPEDAFPPPPPLDDHGGFVTTSLPSWSPPPARSKKLDPVPPAVPFYSQQPTYFTPQQTKEDVTRDQNAIIAPPPGLSRRPSMTVPWQVAEAVLNTPQTTSGRKTLLSPTHSGSFPLEPVSSNMFAIPSKGPASRNADGLKSPAAEVAAELSALSLSRQRSGAGVPQPNTTVPSMLGTSPPSGSAGARRGSFGNAAEFFKFRRRSKSRLELARDLSGEAGGFPNYGATAVGMPGIDERRVDIHDNFSMQGHADSHSTTSNDDDDDEEATPYEPDDGGDFGGSEGGGSFVSFYNATGAGRSRDAPGGLSALSIPPPPPPPPLTDDEDEGSTTSSSKGLPMMSPNGFRLRKVAEMARRGSLSSEDKTRVKDEIIQSSLGIGANNAARILTGKSTSVPTTALQQGERPPVSPAVAGPPPGFQRLGTTPPRGVPMAATAKTIPAGIVRSTSSGIAARSPAKPSMMPSPSRGNRKALSPNSTNAGSGTLEERLTAAAQRVADCVGKGDMVGFQQAMDELDRLRAEANSALLQA